MRAAGVSQSGASLVFNEGPEAGKRCTKVFGRGEAILAGGSTVSYDALADRLDRADDPVTFTAFPDGSRDVHYSVASGDGRVARGVRPPRRVGC